LHWFFDFYFEVAIVGGSIFGGLFSIVEYVLFLTGFVVGVLSVLVAIAWFIRKVRKIMPRERPTTYKTPGPDSMPVQA
jgi:hypothetical protein